MEKFHFTYLNSRPNDADVINRFKTAGCYDILQNRMGYRFELVLGSYPRIVIDKSKFRIKILIFNRGFASVFNMRIVYLVLIGNINGRKEKFELELKTDPRLWSPGEITYIDESIELPKIKSGIYNLYLWLPDRSTSIKSIPDYAIRFSNDEIWSPVDGLNDLKSQIYVIS